MNQKRISTSRVRNRAIDALRDAFALQRTGVEIDDKGYVKDFRDTLLPMVSPEDFEADLRAADGNELQTKFRAIHSSSGLAVNCFAPFRRRIDYLTLKKDDEFERLQFECKCPTGLRGGRAPNLDVP